MDTQELNRLYEKRIKALNPYILSECGWDFDSRQEQYIGVYEALKNNPSANFRYLRTRGKWSMLRAIKKGRSIDNGFWNRDKLDLVHFDQIEDSEAASIILKDENHRPLDEQVIEKITFERFFDSLTTFEKMFIRCKMDGEPMKKIRNKLRLSKKGLKKIKDSIRFKINEAYAC